MRFLRLLPALLACACSRQGPPPFQDYKRQARPIPLAGAALMPLPLGSIKPRGWLRRQLEIQAQGLSGELESFWPSLKDSAWKGGSGDAWERGPYYLDGLVPLAFLLEDKALLRKMQAWMEWNLRSVRPDGSFGPAAPRDWWPDMVMLKVFQQYYEASSDPRVMPLLEGYAKFLQANLGTRRLDGWRQQRRYDEQARGEEDLVGNSDRWQYYRWQELVLALLWLEARTGKGELNAVARQVYEQGYKWETHFYKFRYKKKTAKNEVFLANHGVNNAMGLKAPEVRKILFGHHGKNDEPLVGYKTLMRWHGQANGMFSADEQLAGLSPSQGTELCAVAETMASLSVLYWIDGDHEAADALERIAFNAWPATFDEGMWAHQYDQQANQVLVTQAWRGFTNNKDRANLFGLEPEWGCCTANFHQGWPKFAASLWMANHLGGLSALSYAPCEVELETDGGLFKMAVEGDYPFDSEVRLRILSAPEKAFFLQLRVPAWAPWAGAELGTEKKRGIPGGEIHFERIWKAGEVVKLSFPMRTKVEAWQQSKILTRGPLLFALELEPEVRMLGSERWSDREMTPKSAWNLAPLAGPGSEVPDTALSRRPADGNVFDRFETPLRLRLKARSVSNWGEVHHSAAEPPLSPQFDGPEIDASFIPYGAAKLRVSVFPAAP